MKAIRCGSGLGDNIYLHSIVRHLIEKGEEIEVCTNWPDLFQPFNGQIKLSPHRRTDIDLIAHYTQGKTNKTTDQFEDMCIRAGLPRNIELRTDWKPLNKKLVERIGALPRPIIAVQLPRYPMDRKDGFGRELLPDQGKYRRALELIGGNATKIQIGSGDALYQLSDIDLNLANQTSVSDVLDIATVVDGFIGYVSFFVPLAESLNKPGLFIWSRRGLQSDTDYIKTITPKKIIHRPDLLRAVIDDCSEEELKKAVDALLEQVRSSTILCW